MVRSQRYLEIIAEDRLIERAAATGAHLLKGLEALAAERADVVSNPRGKGLMCAIEFRDASTRDAVARKAYEFGMIILPCGVSSLRFRPPLDVTSEELDEALAIVRRAIDAAVRA
jgi:L-lysine 6-transaminase